MAFTYDALSQKDHIHTLTVLTALSPQGIIQCKMHHITISDAFICLSYTWGLPAPDLGCILLNGVIVSVRPNLIKFLETARIELHSQPLWINTVCINQDDDIGKGIQV